MHNIALNETVGSLPYSSVSIKCVLVADLKLFVGLSTGEIAMYDLFTLELLDKAATNRQATPVSLVL